MANQQYNLHLKATKSDFEKMDGNIAEMYARKCKKPTCEPLCRLFVFGLLLMLLMLLMVFVLVFCWLVFD